MRKYIQITVVAGIFFLLAWLRNGRSSDVGNIQPIVPNTTSSTDNTTPAPTPTPTSTPSSTPTPSPTPTPSTPTTKPRGQYSKDGSFTGSVEDAFYGNIQVKAVIKNGFITDVVFLQYPNDNRTSQRINSQAMPLLTQEAIQAQSAQVDGVSGASDSSPAFARSLQTALQKAG